MTLVHGGPYGRHTDRLNLDWHPSAQWLATAGYAVLLPNPCGSKGYGHDFAARAAGAVGLDELSEICAGIDLLVDEEVADPSRLGIGGWSHGGFVSAWAVVGGGGRATDPGSRLCGARGPGGHGTCAGSDRAAPIT